MTARLAATPPDVWSCANCGPHPTSRAGWCDAGCGSDHGGMSRIPADSVMLCEHDDYVTVDANGCGLRRCRRCMALAVSWHSEVPPLPPWFVGLDGRTVWGSRHRGSEADDAGAHDATRGEVGP